MYFFVNGIILYNFTNLEIENTRIGNLPSMTRNYENLQRVERNFKSPDV